MRTSGPADVSAGLVARRSPGILLAAVAVAALGIAIAWTRTPSADVLWLVDVARRVARGQVLYRDVLEINPPLIVWLLLPFARTAHPLQWFLAGTVALAVASSVLAARAFGRPGMLVAALALLLVVPIGWFGQREHLAIALILPWLLGTLRGRDGLLEGVLAGIGFSLKPQLLLAFALVTFFTRRLDRGSVAVLVVVGIYPLLVALLTPDYFWLVRRLGPDYLAYNRAAPAGLLWTNPCAWLSLLGPAAWLAVRRRARDRQVGDGLALATLGFLAGAVVQAKGWNYHYAPAVTTSGLLLYLVAAEPLRPAVLLARCVAAALLVGFVAQGLRGRFAPRPAGAVARPGVDRATYDRLVAALGDAGHPRSVLALYRHSGQAFVLSAYGGARFVSPFPMVWVLDLPDWPAKLPWWTDRIAQAARRDPPDLVLIARDTTGGPDGAQVLAADTAISALLARYLPRPDVEGYRVWVRPSATAGP